MTEEEKCRKEKDKYIKAVDALSEGELYLYLCLISARLGKIFNDKFE